MALTDNLIAYWKLDETSGNAADSVGSNTLTDNNTVGTAAGKVGTCRDFESSSTEFLSITDNADLSFGNEDFTITGWINFESLGVRWFPFGKVSGAGATEYYVDYDSSSTRVRFAVGNGSTVGTVSATNLGAPSTATWYFVVAWHDATANTVNIQVNNGTPNSASFSDGCADLGGGFSIGKGGDFGTYYDGLVDEVGIWGRVLTSDERTALYNSGNGTTYPFGGGSPSSPPFNSHLVHSPLIGGRLVV
jgi:hypothetical protein